MKKVTIKDIARMADVSPTTVSLVLNHKKTRVSDITKKTIFDIAEKYNYTPNMNARGLVSNKTNTVGLIIPDIENPFFSSLAKSLEIELKKEDYSLILINTDDLFDNDYNAISLLNNRGVDAFILALSYESYQKLEEIKILLSNLGKPYVLIDRYFDNIKANQVSSNNEVGQYMAIKFLLDQGIKRIGYIAAPKNSLNGKARLRGYKKALKEAGVPIDDKLIKFGNFRFESGYDLTGEIVEHGVEAIATANDMMAYGILMKLNQLNLKVPEDISVVGYDDLFYSSIDTISLTTVKQDHHLLGKEAVRLLMNAIKDITRIEEVVLKPELIIRKSVKINKI